MKLLIKTMEALRKKIWPGEPQQPKAETDLQNPWPPDLLSVDRLACEFGLRPSRVRAELAKAGVTQIRGGWRRSEAGPVLLRVKAGAQ